MCRLTGVGLLRGVQGGFSAEVMHELLEGGQPVARPPVEGLSQELGTRRRRVHHAEGKLHPGPLALDVESEEERS